MEAMELGKLGSDEVVIDRPGSHLHSCVRGVLKEALLRIISGEKQFLQEQIVFEYPVGETSCVVTSSQDEVIYAQRPKRGGLTRFVKNRKAESCNSVVVVLKKGDQGQFHGTYYVLVTAYIGVPVVEPWDERSFSQQSNPDLARQQSREFWETHALVWGSQEVVLGSETSVCPW